MLKLTEEELNTVLGILRKHLSNAEIIFFGSRVKGKLKAHSDLDFAINAFRVLSISELSLIENDFEQSELPFRVDIHDLHSLDSEFKRIIQENCEIIKF